MPCVAGNKSMHLFNALVLACCKMVNDLVKLTECLLQLGLQTGASKAICQITSLFSLPG